MPTDVLWCATGFAGANSLSGFQSTAEDQTSPGQTRQTPHETPHEKSHQTPKNKQHMTMTEFKGDTADTVGIRNEGNTCYFSSTTQLLRSLSTVNDLANNHDAFCKHILSQTSTFWSYTRQCTTLWQELARHHVVEQRHGQVSKATTRLHESQNYRNASTSSRQKMTQRTKEVAQKTYMAEHYPNIHADLSNLPVLSATEQESASVLMTALLTYNNVFPFGKQAPAPHTDLTCKVNVARHEMRKAWDEVFAGEEGALQSACTALQATFHRCELCGSDGQSTLTPLFSLSLHIQLAGYDMRGFPAAYDEGVSKIQGTCPNLCDDSAVDLLLITQTVSWPRVLLIELSRGKSDDMSFDTTFVDIPLHLKKTTNIPAYRLSGIIYRENYLDRSDVRRIPDRCKSTASKTVYRDARGISAGSAGHYMATVVQWSGCAADSPRRCWFTSDQQVGRIKNFEAHIKKYNQLVSMVAYERIDSLSRTNVYVPSMSGSTRRAKEKSTNPRRR
jgi:hypothetical protein